MNENENSIQLTYKFKKGNTLKYNIEKFHKERASKNGIILKDEGEREKFISIQEVLEVDNNNTGYIRISTEKEKSKHILEIKIDKNGNILKENGENKLPAFFYLPDKKVNFKDTWHSPGKIYIPDSNISIENKILFLLSKSIYISNFNCLKINIVPQEIIGTIKIEGYDCKYITNWSGEFYIEPEEGFLVKSVQSSNIIIKKDDYIFDSRIEVTSQIANK